MLLDHLIFLDLLGENGLDGFFHSATVPLLVLMARHVPDPLLLWRFHCQTVVGLEVLHPAVVKWAYCLEHGKYLHLEATHPAAGVERLESLQWVGPVSYSAPVCVWYLCAIVRVSEVP